MIWHYYPVLDSTQAQAKRLSGISRSDAFVIVAAKQTAGHGQYNRQFLSPRGGLYMTVAQTLPQTTVFHTPLSYRIGVRICQYLQTLCPDITMNYPNDIMLQSKKLGGILCESYPTHTRGHRRVYIGIGMNINQTRPPLATATTLRVHTNKSYTISTMCYKFISCI